MRVLYYINGIAMLAVLIFLGEEFRRWISKDERKRVKQAKGLRNEETEKKRRLIPILKKLLFRYDFIEAEVMRLKTVLKAAGYIKDGAAEIYWLVRYVMPFVVMLLGIAGGRGLVFSICLAGLCELVAILFVNGRAKERNKRFNKCAYKIYKYMSSQVTSGIKPIDAMKVLYQVVDDKEISYALAAFSAQFSLTQDFRESSKQLEERFSGREVEALVMVLEQGVKTGDNTKMLERQEQIMFDAYMNSIQEETERAKLIALCAAVVYGIVAVFMISIPLVVEMLNGFGNIFTN